MGLAYINLSSFEDRYTSAKIVGKLFISERSTYENYINSVRRELGSITGIEYYSGAIWFDKETFNKFVDKLKLHISTNSSIKYMLINDFTTYELFNSNKCLLCNHCGSSNIDDNGPVWKCNSCCKPAGLLSL